jgi:hypothetical protein
VEQEPLDKVITAEIITQVRLINLVEAVVQLPLELALEQTQLAVQALTLTLTGLQPPLQELVAFMQAVVAVDFTPEAVQQAAQGAAVQVGLRELMALSTLAEAAVVVKTEPAAVQEALVL